MWKQYVLSEVFELSNSYCHILIPLSLGKNMADSGTNDDSLPVAADSSSNQATDGDGNTGRVKQVVVTTVNTIVDKACVQEDVYAKTNYHIKQSQEYIPSRKLNFFITFRGFICFMTTVLCIQLMVLVLATIILGAAQTTFSSSLTCFTMSLGIIIILIPTFMVYCQHIHVVCWTVRLVLSQPVAKSSESAAEHVEIAVTDLKGAYLSAHKRGIGLISQTSGMIKFQMLSLEAAKQIRWARVISIVLAVITFLVSIWVSVVGVISIAQIIITAQLV